jgi:hypothetical protein
MSDLLIKDVDPELMHKLEESAKTHSKSLSDEAKSLIRNELEAISPIVAESNETKEECGLGTKMFNLIHPEDRGDDLVFEIRGEASEPPDFE